MGNLGKWDTWYAGLEADSPQTYGGTESYRIASDWLVDCSTVGDWGCGKGGFKQYVEAPRQYIGFDGSHTPFADRIVDLADFRFETEGVLVRHVIEHDYRWEAILANAAASFTRRMVLVLFTPMLTSTEPMATEIAFQELGAQGGVPDLSFSEAAIRSAIPDVPVSVQTIDSLTQYGTETIFLYER
jgi:hypothetical protein